MKTKFSIIISLVFLAFSATHSQDIYEESYVLRYNMKLNDSFILDNNFYYVQYSSPEGVNEKLRIASGFMKMKYRVVEITNNQITFEIEYIEKHRENCTKNEKAISDYEELKGKKIQYCLSKVGKIGDFENVDIELDEENKSLLTNLEEEIIHLMPTLPDDPVKIGDQWIASNGQEREEFENFTLVYTLMDEVVFNGYDCLKFIANYNTNESFEVPGNEEKINVEVSDKGHDIYFFAYKEGMLIARKSIGNGLVEIFNSKGELIDTRANNVLYETEIKL